MAQERMGRRGVRRGELTPGELNEVAGEAEAGGFSRRMTGAGAGRPARNAFSTGFAPISGRAQAVQIDRNASTASQIGQYIKNTASTWATRGANWILGGYMDKGQVELDTSVDTPKTTGGFEAALHMGTYGDQYSIGVLGRKGGGPYGSGYLGEVVVPPHLSRTQFYKDRGMSVPLNESIEPSVSRGLAESINPATGQPQIRERIKIDPSRLEQVQVEAAEMAREGLKVEAEGKTRKMRLKDDK